MREIHVSIRPVHTAALFANLGHNTWVVSNQKAQEDFNTHPSQIVLKSFMLLETDKISIPATLFC